MSPFALHDRHGPGDPQPAARCAHERPARRPDPAQIMRVASHLDSLARNLRRLGFAEDEVGEHVGPIVQGYQRQIAQLSRPERQHA